MERCTEAPARVSSNWVIGKAPDLALIIGSTVAGYAYLALNLLLQVPISYLWWFWSVGLDGTHIFGTASRTYFDAQERRRRGTLLFGSLAVFFAVGPLMVLAGYKSVLAIAVGTWAYYHVVKQHQGFVILYKVKNRDLDPVDNELDRLFLAVMLMMPPFHRFFIHNPEELGIPPTVALERVAPWVEPLLWALVVWAGGRFALRQVQRLRLGLALNIPKLLLLAGVSVLHWLTFSYMSWQAAVPTVTIVHNLQYHALILFHNRNKYTGEGAQPSSGRIPKWVSANLGAYVTAALVFSLLYRVPGSTWGGCQTWRSASSADSVSRTTTWIARSGGYGTTAGCGTFCG